MATKTRRRSSGGKSDDFIVADFSKEEGGASRVRVPEGDYRAKIVAVKSDTSKEGNRMYVFTFKGLEGKLKGREVRDYCPITPKALWKLRSLLEAAGAEVPHSSLRIKKSAVIGKELGITLGDDEYNGRISSKIQDYLDLDTLAGADVEDDEDLEDEDEEETEEEEDELDDLDRSGLKKYIVENDLEVKVRKSMSEDDIRDAIREAEGDEEDEDEEIEELELDEDL